jgi:hypothetical protein
MNLLQSYTREKKEYIQWHSTSAITEAETSMS